MPPGVIRGETCGIDATGLAPPSRHRNAVGEKATMSEKRGGHKRGGGDGAAHKRSLSNHQIGDQEDIPERSSSPAEFVKVSLLPCYPFLLAMPSNTPSLGHPAGGSDGRNL